MNKEKVIRGEIAIIVNIPTIQLFGARYYYILYSQPCFRGNNNTSKLVKIRILGLTDRKVLYG